MGIREPAIQGIFSPLSYTQGLVTENKVGRICTRLWNGRTARYGFGPIIGAAGAPKLNTPKWMRREGWGLRLSENLPHTHHTHTIIWVCPAAGFCRRQADRQIVGKTCLRHTPLGRDSRGSCCRRNSLLGPFATFQISVTQNLCTIVNVCGSTDSDRHQTFCSDFPK